MTKTIIDYKIVKSNYTKKLAEGVNLLLKEGYVPQGGIAYIKTQNLLHRESVAQAMVLYSSPDSLDPQSV